MIKDNKYNNKWIINIFIINDNIINDIINDK